MDDSGEFVENFLEHYSSQFYDPVKAHAYYLRTRQLKGRQSTKGLTKLQREGFAYAKNQIGIAKKNETKQLSDAQKAFSDKTRAVAAEHRKAISDKLKTLIAALPPTPKGISKEDRAKLTSDRAAQLDKIRGDSIAERDAVITGLKSALTNARSNYQKLKDKLKVKYEQAAQKEFEAIKQKV